MMAYFDGLVDIRHVSTMEQCIKSARALTSTRPYILPWKNIYVVLPDLDLTNDQILHVLNGSIVGLLSYDNGLLPDMIHQKLLRLIHIPLLPCIGLGKMK